MLDRRRALQTGLATAVSLPATLRLGRAQQRKTPAKVSYSEVARNVLFAPAYVALAKGLFSDAGLNVTLRTAQGGDKAVAELLSNSADIALMGPESTIYVQNSDSPVKIPMFCGLILTDGFVLVGREKPSKFEWQQLRGKQIFALRPGSTPNLFLEAALRQNGIDPLKDVKLVSNVAIPARIGAWLAGQHQYAIFSEPEASQLELDGKAFFLASPGQTVGTAQGTAFMATDKFIRDHPDVIQSWTDAIYRAQQWTATAPTVEIAKVLELYFPGVAASALAAAVERYRSLKLWKTTPAIDLRSIDKIEDVLIQGNVLERRVKFGDLVLPGFASRAN